MSAVVSVPSIGIRTREVLVPRANGYEIDGDVLHLKTSAWGGDKIAVFKSWESVVITPDRGANGRFIKKGY